jgi:hypothetical protein
MTVHIPAFSVLTGLPPLFPWILPILPPTQEHPSSSSQHFSELSRGSPFLPPQKAKIRIMASRPSLIIPLLLTSWISDLLTTLLLSHPAPAMWASHMLRYTRHNLNSGPLHLLLPLPQTLFLVFTWVPLSECLLSGHCHGLSCVSPNSHAGALLFQSDGIWIYGFGQITRFR